MPGLRAIPLGRTFPCRVSIPGRITRVSSIATEKKFTAVYRPTDDRKATENALGGLLDLLFEERGYQPMAGSKAACDKVRASWFHHLLPPLDENQVLRVLQQRRFVIVQGPPGTGKTHLATGILKRVYQGRGKTIQFHPNTTYETFIGGLAPAESEEALGFRFQPRPGFLMEAAAEALANPSKPYLLHIDEINRADLGKILGEAVFLLEPTGCEGCRADAVLDEVVRQKS